MEGALAPNTRSMWRRLARVALGRCDCGVGSTRGRALTELHLFQPVGGARGYAKAKKTPAAKKRGGAVQGGSAPTSPAMKRSVDSHWQLLVDAATPAVLEPENLSETTLAEFAAKAQAYSSKKMAQHRAWQGDMNQKIRLKRAAIAALPSGFLRDEASKEDLTLFPLSRQSPLMTPPIDGYWEKKQRMAEEAVSGAGPRSAGPTR